MVLCVGVSAHFEECTRWQEARVTSDSQGQSSAKARAVQPRHEMSLLQQQLLLHPLVT